MGRNPERHLAPARGGAGAATDSEALDLIGPKRRISVTNVTHRFRNNWR